MEELFISEAEPYLRSYPFFSHDRAGNLDGNSILYAGTYGLLYSKLFTKYPLAADHSTLLYVKSYLPEHPGVITRGPHKWLDPQTHDDYIGLCTLSFLNHSGAANAIYLHGKQSHWSYFRGGESRDKFNSLFWRIPGVVQHIKLCAREKLNLFDAIWLAAGILGSAYGKGDESGKILKWHMVSVYESQADRNWLCDWAAKTWKRKLIENYPGAMGDVFGIYFGGNHLFCRWANGVI